jgi:hypothetical protein
MLFKAVLICLLLILPSCASRPSLYEWGSYEDSLSKVFNSGSEPFLVNDELELLGQEINASRPGKIPPGKIAHLGYLNAVNGNTDLARDFFNQEKMIFPESTIFMDRLIKMLDEKEKKNGLK